MTTPSAKGGIPLPLGTDVVSRAARIAELNAIDTAFALQSQADRPFFLSAYTYDSGNNRLVLTIQPGRVHFGAVLVDIVTPTTVFVPTPAVATTYYVYVTSAAGFVSNTTGTPPANAVPICSVTTANPVATGTLTRADRRAELPSGDAPTGVTAGVYGSASAAPVLTIDAYGRVTSVTVSTITPTTNTVGTAAILDGAVTTVKLAASGATPGTYGSATQSAVAVVDATGRITSVSVVTITPGTNSVGTSAILDGAVTAAKIADGNVTTAKIGDANVTSAKIPPLAIITSHLAASAVASGKIAVDAVGAAEIVAGAVGVAEHGVMPSAKAFNSATQSVSNGVTAAATFDSESWDNSTMHSTSSNTSRITVPSAGVYIVTGELNPTAGGGATGSGYQHGAAIRVNGTTLVARHIWSEGTTTMDGRSISAQVKLAASDYVELMLINNGATPVLIEATLAATWVSAG